MTKTVLLFSLVALSIAGCNSCNHVPKDAKPLKLPTGTAHRPQGLPALTVKPGPEPFSKADVLQYVTTHRLPKSLGEPSQLQVDSLEFITAGEVTTRLQGASTGLKNDERVGYAVVTGPMTFTGPQTKPVVFQRGYVMFDAATGNLLMLGTLDSGGPVEGTPQKPR